MKKISIKWASAECLECLQNAKCLYLAKVWLAVRDEVFQ